MGESSAPELMRGTAILRPRRFVHIRELDGVRGVAALMVFFHHVCFISINPTGWPKPILLLRTISISGRYGVDLFFALSGFLITSLLINAREERSYYHDFYWKRALRILPIYVLCLLGLLIYIRGSWSYVLLSAFFLANFSSLFHISASGPFWTLAIEEQFYLIWPTVVRLRPVGQLRRWAIVIAATVFLLRLIAACFGHANYIFTFFHCDGLACGAFLACWHFERDSVRPNRTLEKCAIALAFFLGAVLSVLPLPRFHIAFAFSSAMQQTGVTLLCCSIIAFVISRSGQPSLALFRSWLLTFFGLISYAMYMFHAYVANEYDRLRGPLQDGDLTDYVIRFLSILSISVALCLLSRYLIELPAMGLRRFVLAKPSPHIPDDPPIPLGNM